METYRKLLIGVGLMFVVMLGLFAVPTVYADVPCDNGGAVLNREGATKTIAAGRSLCFTVDVPANQRNLLITFSPGSGKYNLYVGKNKQLRDASDRLGIGVITSRTRQWTISNPTNGMYYVAVQAIDVGSTMTIKANVLPPNAGASTNNGCTTTSSGERLCSSGQPQTVGELDVPNLDRAWLPATIPFTVPDCGIITVSANWKSDVPYRLVLNGPLRPDLGSPYVTIGDQTATTTRLQYEITSADAAAGKQWEASLYLTKNTNRTAQGTITVDVQRKACLSDVVKVDPPVRIEIPTVLPPSTSFVPSILGSSQWGNGRLVLMVRGKDGNAYLRWRDGRGWNDWQSQGLATKFAPASGSSAGKQLDMVAVGSDGAMQWGRNVNGDWSGWSSLAGTLNSAPAVVSRRDGSLIDVFARAGNRIWLIQRRDGNWGSWIPLDGDTAPVAPAATAYGDDRIDMFVVAPNGNLLHQKYEGGAWLNGWENLDGVLTSAPAAAVSNGTLFVFGRGTDGALWYRSFNGQWSGWASLGGTITSAPVAATWSKTQLVVSALGSDGQIYQIIYDGGWGNWAQFGPLP